MRGPPTSASANRSISSAAARNAAIPAWREAGAGFEVASQVLGRAAPRAPSPARSRHARAAEQRVTGAIERLVDRMRLRLLRRAAE